jgi:hypothetical protein
VGRKNYESKINNPEPQLRNKLIRHVLKLYAVKAYLLRIVPKQPKKQPKLGDVAKDLHQHNHLNPPG